MAALFLLNLYYKDNNGKYDNHVNTLSVQPSFWFTAEFYKKVDSPIFSVLIYSAIPPLERKENTKRRFLESAYVGAFVDRFYKEYFMKMKTVLLSLPEFLEYKKSGQPIVFDRDPFVMARDVGAWYSVNEMNKCASFEDKLSFLQNAQNFRNDGIPQNKIITQENISEICAAAGEQSFINKVLNDPYGIPRMNLENTPFIIELNKNQPIYQECSVPTQDARSSSR